MSGVNASIPLQVNPSATAGPDLGQTMSLASMAQQLQIRRQAMQSQNALKGILGRPGAVDPTTGVPTAEAMQQVMAVDPETGMKIQQNALAMQGQQAQLQEHRLKRQGMIDDILEPVRVDSYTAYQNALKAGQSPEAAKATGQRVYTQGLDGVTSAGHFSADEQKMLLPDFVPERVFSRSPTLQKVQQTQTTAKRADTELGLRVRADERAEGTQTETMRHNRAVEEGGSPTKAQEKDVESLADAAIADRNKELAADKKPLLTTAEAAKIRIDTRNNARPANASVVSDDVAELAAERFLAGDKTAAVGFGRSPASQTKINNAIAAKARALGMSGAEVAARVAEYAGETQAMRTLGTRQVGMEIAANEVKTMAPLALSASAAVDRTKYPALNSIILAAEKGTGDENVVRFGLAANSLIYTYAKFLNPTGIPTDSDKAKASDILSTAWSKGQFSAAIDQIKKEIVSGQSALKTTRDEVSQTISGKPGSGDAAPAAGPAAASALPEAARASLKRGVMTTFGNGQVWTLDDTGNPKKVR